MYENNEKEVIELHYNYNQSLSDGKEIFRDEWITAKVGERNVIFIKEHGAQGEGDKWYYDIIYNNGIIERTFNPCRVFYKIK